MQSSFWKRHGALLLGLFVAFGAAILYGARLEVPVVSDEVITLANGEYLLGNDWSYMIAATGGYYFKWFYGVLMTPVLWLFRDSPHNAYRAMMILNGMLQAGTMPVCYFICRRYLRVKSPWCAAGIGVCAAFVPSVFLYAFYARGDLLLSIVPWYVLALLLEGLKAEQEHDRSRRAVCTALAAGVSVIAFMAHTRGIVVIVALLLTVLLVRICEKKNPVSWPVLLAVGAAAFLLDLLLAQHFKTALYWIRGALANTLDAVPLNSFFDIFSFRVLKSMAGISVGWLYTLLSSTYGLILLGILACLDASIRMVRGGGGLAAEEKLAALFSLLVFAGYFLSGLLLFKGNFYSLKYDVMDQRVDSLLYDRYSSCGAGLPVFAAVYILAARPRLLTRPFRLASLVLWGLLLLAFFTRCFDVVTSYPGYLYNTIALHTFSRVEDPWEILWGGYYTKRALLGAGALGSAGFLLSLFWPRKNEGRSAAALLLVIVCAQLLLVRVNYRKVRLATNDVVEESTAPVVELVRELDVAEDFPYIYKCSSKDVRIQYYQMQLPEQRLFSKGQRKDVEGDYLVICPPEDVETYFGVEDALFRLDRFDYENAEYNALYVYGEGLRQLLTQRGYDLTPLDLPG